MTTKSQRYYCLTLYLLTWRLWWAPNNASKGQMEFNSAFKGLIRNWRNATSKHACPEAQGSSPTARLTLQWAHNPFRGNSSNWHISQEEAGRLIPKRRHGNWKGHHGRPLKRILDLWDQNDAIRSPHSCYLDDDNEDDDITHSSLYFVIYSFRHICITSKVWRIFKNVLKQLVVLAFTVIRYMAGSFTL